MGEIALAGMPPPALETPAVPAAPPGPGDVRLQRINGTPFAWLGQRVASAAPEATEPPRRAPMAMNLAGLADWSPEQPFIDRMKLARPWVGHRPGQWGAWEHKDFAAGGYLDKDGWITRMPEGLTGYTTLLMTNMPTEATSLAGRYRLSWQGEGQIDLDGSVKRIERQPGALVFDYAPGPETTILVTVSSTDPKGTGNHIRDMTLVKEEDRAAFEAGAIFNPAFLARMRGVAALRFMDWMATNGSQIEHWDQRPKPADYTYARIGVPAEVMVTLANALDADPWFTLPHKADDAYFRAFADLVHDQLDPARRVYAEYSNEVWNWAFPQAEWARQQAIARWGADAPGDAFLQFEGMRAARMATIWDEVFGPDADERLVTVISTQTGWLGAEENLLAAPLWVAEDPARNRPPAEAFDAYGITGYFSGKLGEDPKAAEVMGWIADSRARAEADAAPLAPRLRQQHIAAHQFDAAIETAAAELLDGSVTGDPEGSVTHLLDTLLPYHAARAEGLGLDLVVYEGGTHVVGLGPWQENETLTAFFGALNYSAEMGGLYRTLLDGWDRVGGGTLFTAYNDVGGPSKWGSWGAIRWLEDDNPRWRALADRFGDPATAVRKAADNPRETGDDK